YVIKWRGEHIFNPSNIGLVLCFLLLGRARAAPLDFWWGPMSLWLALALALIVTGGFLILRRLKLLRVAVGFWITFAFAIGVLALSGHTMTARWHLGPISLVDRRLVIGIAAAAVAVAAGAMVVGNAPAVAADASRAVPVGSLPRITILPGQGVQTKLDEHTAQLIAHDLIAAKASAGSGPLRVWLVQGA